MSNERRFRAYKFDLTGLERLWAPGEHHCFIRSWPARKSRVIAVNSDCIDTFMSGLVVEHPSFDPVPVGQRIPSEYITVLRQDSLWRYMNTAAPLLPRDQEPLLVAAYDAAGDLAVFSGYFDPGERQWYVRFAVDLDYSPQRIQTERVIAWKPWPEPPPLAFLAEREKHD